MDYHLNLDRVVNLDYHYHWLFAKAGGLLVCVLLQNTEVLAAAEAVTQGSWGSEGSIEDCLKTAMWLFRSSTNHKRWLVGPTQGDRTSSYAEVGDDIGSGIKNIMKLSCQGFFVWKFSLLGTCREAALGRVLLKLHLALGTAPSCLKALISLLGFAVLPMKPIV